MTETSGPRRTLLEDDGSPALVIDAEGVSDIDTTAVRQLDALLGDLDAADVAVAFARVHQPVREMLERAGITERIGDDAIFLEADDAVAHHVGGTDLP